MMFLLYCYFNQINAGLVIIKDFFQKHSQKKKNPDQSQTFFNVKKDIFINYFTLSVLHRWGPLSEKLILKVYLLKSCECVLQGCGVSAFKPWWVCVCVCVLLCSAMQSGDSTTPAQALSLIL